MGLPEYYQLRKVIWTARSLILVGSPEDVDQVFGKREAAHDFYIRLLMYAQRNEVV